jgi:hypothetical protein
MYKINLKRVFKSTGGLVVMLVALLALNGYLDHTEAERKYDHCIELGADKPFTTMKNFNSWKRRCASQAGYSLPASELIGEE